MVGPTVTCQPKVIYKLAYANYFLVFVGDLPGSFCPNVCFWLFCFGFVFFIWQFSSAFPISRSSCKPIDPVMGRMRLCCAVLCSAVESLETVKAYSECSGTVQGFCFSTCHLVRCLLTVATHSCRVVNWWYCSKNLHWNKMMPSPIAKWSNVPKTKKYLCFKHGNLQSMHSSAIGSSYQFLLELITKCPKDV